ncbi:LmeA family phospholipid-binding protein [Mycobacterium sherrisii]|uniref:DUF2993 domain-containing protein n=1 Tax=Mycobacterium sherrisii TaxID=243061 RepID=A0A1E3SW68_9MYCO|nr:DUF2993 domain-containing protein [Mycobacterium sherrisii]MCV7031313.1 DUF2993 domain-containing protein [Mycobacterium sherrisii]MEC4764447.1 DUF2993 domain-containing protein [Mycobacterium sherrisii]ODR05883.1 hypothetical protein BHQ21_13045 [Mycobacterium sherrisii]ORW78219.1 hypothetical protein AWC25_06430 [Mycobacterium sherrisii]
MTNPQGPSSEGPSSWARPGNQTPFGPPTERPTERLSAPGNTPPPHPAAAAGGPRPGGPAGPDSPGGSYAPPPAPPTQRTAAPSEEPAPKKGKRLRDPLAIVLICVIVVSLVLAGLIGGELYARHVANNKVAQAVACEVQDQATASFGVAPLLLWQLATQHFTNISVSTAGNQVRDAKAMKIDISIKDVKLDKTANAKGTIGALDATITWTSDGIKQSVQNAIPVLGPFVTNSVTTHPSDGTVELKGMLDNITTKPVVSGNGIQLQIQSFNALGFTMPRESVQSTLDSYTQKLTANYPLGIHADSVQVTDSGVTSHFSTRNATIPAGDNNDSCFANL